MKINKILKGVWRIFLSIRGRKLNNIRLYAKYLHDLSRFKKLSGVVHIDQIAPSFDDWTINSQTGGGHYFYQDIWALRKIKEISPSLHFDVGSRYDGFVGQASAFVKIIAIDIRPIHFSLSNFSFLRSNILQLPFKSGSVFSISSLHTIEHIGLGRYKDNIDPSGHEKALLELQRVIIKGGYLLVSFPIGQERVEFNSQRILHPLRPVEILREMRLIEFSAINDRDKFIEKTNPANLCDSKFACGLYLFEKIK